METNYEYSYKNPSVISANDNGNAFLFSHCSEIEEDNHIPCFFYGNIVNSFVASKCLATLAKTVSSHFALTAGQLIYLKDPIVSVGNEELRFEAFSSCNSVYARLDVLKSGVDGEFLHAGCVNIDFNDHTIRAFNMVKPQEKLLLGVGAKEVKIITETTSAVEKKVSLPNRWIKGLGNVQVYLSEMDLAFKINKTEAVQLFKTLPKIAVKGDYYLYKNGLSYSFSPVSKPHSVRIGGIHRLNLLQNLILLVETVSFYKAENEQSTAIVLHFGNMQMLFLFSDNVFRGFSGEGRTLESLTEQIPDEWIVGVNDFFKANEVFNPTLVAIEHDISLKVMDSLSTSLSSLGLLGFDLFNNRYFYRRLPFKLDRLRSFNPRLENALKLLNKDEVQIVEQTNTYIKAEVKGTAGVIHTVIKKNNDYQCTCNWYTSNKNNRGLCKHILAVKMKLSR